MSEEEDDVNLDAMLAEPDALITQPTALSPSAQRAHPEALWNTRFGQLRNLIHAHLVSAPLISHLKSLYTSNNHLKQLYVFGEEATPRRDGLLHK